MDHKLPSEQELNELYDLLNQRYWEDKLPKVPVRWSERMHALAGQYWRSKKRGWEIVLSVPYHTHFPEEVEDTLKHEMIHVWMHKTGKRKYGVMHGLEFEAEAKRIGASRYARYYEGMHRPYKYEWECPNCHRRSRTRIWVDLACGSCCREHNNGRYTRRFKLKLVKVLE